MTALRRLALALLLTTPVAAGAANAATTAQLYQASYDLESAQNYEGALAQVEQLRASGEDDYVVHLRHGWLLYLVGRYGDAVAAYQRAAEREPGSAEAYTGLALPLMAQRRWSEAERACRSALKAAPGNYLGMSRLAYVLYSAGKYTDAASQYEAVLKLYPSDVEMRAGLGWALLKKGDAAKAKKTFAEVLRTAPSHVSARQGFDAAE
jgi:tetratricopeptide (TPR) repeat protein